MNIRGIVFRSAVLAGFAASLLLTSPREGAAQAAFEAVEWTNVVNASASPSAIWKSGGCAGCTDAGAISRQAIGAGDGYVEFTPGFGARLYAGLGSTITASTDPASIDFAFSFWPDGGWDIRERNSYRAEGRFVAGDVFRVALTGGQVSYYKNGSLVYASTAPVTLPLVFDTTLVDGGAGLSSAVITATASSPSQPVTVLTTSLANGVLAQPYSAALAASGGSGSYVWTLHAGTLPVGFSLSTGGTISGTPTLAGAFSFTVRATDASNGAAYSDRALSLYIPAPSSGSGVTVNTTQLPSARRHESYSAVLSATGGSGAFAWTLVSGTLPAGVSLDANGAVRGTPTVSGRFSVTVRATDTANSTNADDQALTLAVLAAAPPSSYDAVTDRIVREKPATPALGPAGYRFNDPSFGTRMIRITDSGTRPGALNRSYRTPSGTHTNAWSVDGRYFYTTSTDGTLIPFAFDAETMTARRINPSSTGDGGLTLRFFNEPTFSYLTPGVLYGTHNGSGANLRSVDQLDLESGVYTHLLNLDTLAPNLTGTYTGGLGSSAGTVEKIFAFFGGPSQDRHFYLVVFEKNNPAERLLLDTLASTVNGIPTNITLNFKIHAAAIDRSGRYMIVYPTGTDLQSPRYAAPGYIWDLTTNLFTAMPLAETRSGGHDAYGYGYRVNQDCCTSSTWDAAQWQLRSLATPSVTADLIAPVLLPKEIYLADHPSWHQAQPVALVPFLDATYRYGTNTTAWRPWDDEIIAVQTDAAGTGGLVWRFAHHRSNVAHDSDPTRFSFWYTPRANVSPDGRWVLFTSNWDKALGTDPNGDLGGTYRQDMFLVELKSTAEAPPVPTPVSIGTTALPNALQGQSYSASVQASGGSGSYSWSVVSGALPAGLTLNASTGAIAGTPAAPGTATFTVRAADTSNSANVDDQVLTLTVVATPTSPVTITTTVLPDGTRRTFYSASISATGGKAPLTWSVVSGSLPPGLALNASTGVISGTSRDTGTWQFSVRVVDAASPATADTQALSIRIRRR